MSDRTPPDPTGDDELAELRALGRRAGIDADHPLEPLEAPPPGIWDRIAAELDEQPAATADPVARPAGALGRPARHRGAASR